MLKKTITAILVSACLLSSSSVYAVGDVLGCTIVMCLYGAKYGDNTEAEACGEPLGVFKDIQVLKSSGPLGKKIVDCKATIIERKVILAAACQENEYDLDDLVDCSV